MLFTPWNQNEVEVKKTTYYRWICPCGLPHLLKEKPKKKTVLKCDSEFWCSGCGRESKVK